MNAIYVVMAEGTSYDAEKRNLFAVADEGIAVAEVARLSKLHAECCAIWEHMLAFLSETYERELSFQRSKSTGGDVLVERDKAIANLAIEAMQVAILKGATHEHLNNLEFFRDGKISTPVFDTEIVFKYEKLELMSKWN